MSHYSLWDDFWRGILRFSVYFCFDMFFEFYTVNSFPTVGFWMAVLLDLRIGWIQISAEFTTPLFWKQMSADIPIITNYHCGSRILLYSNLWSALRDRIMYQKHNAAERYNLMKKNTLIWPSLYKYSASNDEPSNCELVSPMETRSRKYFPWHNHEFFVIW